MRETFRLVAGIFDRIALPVGLTYEGSLLISHNFGSSDFCGAEANLPLFVGGMTCLAMAVNLATGQIHFASRPRPGSNYHDGPGLG